MEGRIRFTEQNGHLQVGLEVGRARQRELGQYRAQRQGLQNLLAGNIASKTRSSFERQLREVEREIARLESLTLYSRPVAAPYWTAGRGRRLPKKPCSRCGANVGPMPLRVENLRHLGWKPYTASRAISPGAATPRNSFHSRAPTA